MEIEAHYATAMMGFRRQARLACFDLERASPPKASDVCASGLEELILAQH
jgi:hypothetical protein